LFDHKLSGVTLFLLRCLVDAVKESPDLRAKLGDLREQLVNVGVILSEHQRAKSSVRESRKTTKQRVVAADLLLHSMLTE